MRRFFIVICLFIAAASCGDDSLPVGSVNQSSVSSSASSVTDTQPSVSATESTETSTEATQAPPSTEAVITTSPIEGIAPVTKLAGGFRFTEGPVWDSANGSWLFTDIPNQRIVRLQTDGTTSTFASRPGNGIIADSQGSFLLAGSGGRDVVRLGADGSSSTLVDRYEGKRLNSPNDLVELVGSGYFFTDPLFVNSINAELCMGVYFVSYAGEISQIACGPNGDRPNGIELSPDNSTLYVAYTDSGRVTSGTVDASGNYSNEFQFAQTSGSTDGMVVDAAGNIYVTARDGVEVFAPNGSKWGTVSIPEQPANVTLGGPESTTLFITARTSVYSTEVLVRSAR